ncbi:MAG: hypothetical protein RMJ87_13080 [Cytophagales bacterium]|nr:hypothetical protein [Bernardetiaceae bacterium]MDW8205955.1 hypothetical protein [Cytophagales bacterium]
MNPETPSEESANKRESPENADAKLVKDPAEAIVQPLAIEPARNIYQQVKWAAEEANILLEYTVHKGIEIDAETFDTIVAAKYTEQWDAQREAAFWKAYRAISIAVRPATVSSIKAGKSFYGRKISLILKILTGRWSQTTIAQSRIAVLQYRAVAIIVLLAIIIAQIYSFTGSELTKENKALRNNFDSLLVKSWEIQQKMAFATAPADSTQYWQLHYELGKVQTTLEANFNYMIGWHKWWRRAITAGLYTPNIQRDTAAIIDIGWANSNEDFERYRPLARMAYSVGFPLQVVNMYLLPLLYGMMGACAYVLRELSKEVQNMTYSSDDSVNYNLRIQLGALSGLIVGWFLTPVGGTADSLFSVYILGPFALSFLAGYSIELVFSAMDRFIAAFSNKTSGNINP